MDLGKEGEKGGDLSTPHKEQQKIKGQPEAGREAKEQGLQRAREGSFPSRSDVLKEEKVSET